MQNYDSPKSRSDSKSGGALPSKVSVPLPGTNTVQPAYRGGMKQNVPGFGSGLKPGKI